MRGPLDVSWHIHWTMPDCIQEKRFHSNSLKSVSASLTYQSNNSSYLSKQHRPK